jgi:hypothetical protein
MTNQSGYLVCVSTIYGHTRLRCGKSPFLRPHRVLRDSLVHVTASYPFSNNSSLSFIIIEILRVVPLYSLAQNSSGESMFGLRGDSFATLTTVNHINGNTG